MPVLHAYYNFIYLVYIYIEGYCNIKAHEPDSCPQGYVSYNSPTDDFSAMPSPEANCMTATESTA